MVTVGGRTCVKGFDWSNYQPGGDFVRAKAEGWLFGVFRASEDNWSKDPTFLDHVARADAAGLVHGPYHFARPDWNHGTPEEDGRSEARLVLSMTPATAKFLVLDLEATVLDAFNTTQYVIGFWDEVIKSNRFPRRSQRVTYVGKWFSWYHAVTIGQTTVLWIPSYTAAYTPDVDPSQIPLPGWSSDLWPEGWAIWQYSSSGTVAGHHPSDVNVAVLEWFQSVTDDVVIPPQPFPQTPEVSSTMANVYSFPGASAHFKMDRGYIPADAKAYLRDGDTGVYTAAPAERVGAVVNYWSLIDGPDTEAGLMIDGQLTGVGRVLPTGNPSIDKMFTDFIHVAPLEPGAVIG